MFSFGIIVVVLCFVPGPIWSAHVVSHNTADRDSGLSSWCTFAKNDHNYPEIPERCCDVNAYSCDKFIKEKETKYGLKNFSSWTARLCTCDIDFYNCITKDLPVVRQLEVYILFVRDQCFRKMPRHPNAVLDDDEYEFVNAAAMIDETWESSKENEIPVVL